MGNARKGYHHTDATKIQMSKSAFDRYGYTDADRVKPCTVCGKPVPRDYPSWLEVKPTCSDECYRQLMRTDSAVIAGQSKGGKASAKIRKRDGLSESHVAALRKSGEKRRQESHVDIPCDFCGKEFSIYRSRIRDAKKRDQNKIFCSRQCSTAWKKVHSPRGKAHHSYGVPPPKGAGRCKWVEYESPTAGKVNLQGSLEVRFAKLLDASGIRWERPTKDRFPYVGLDGLEHTYTPDFKVWRGEEMFYIETKGYMDEACCHKMSAVSGLMPLIIVRDDDVGRMEAEGLVDIFHVTEP